jgi:type I restriction enzyme, S subunit
MVAGIQIPPGWTSKRLKYVASYNDEVLPESTDELTEINYVEISGVSLAGGVEEINRMTFFGAPSRARRKVRSGDILISTALSLTQTDNSTPTLQFVTTILTR